MMAIRLRVGLIVLAAAILLGSVVLAVKLPDRVSGYGQRGVVTREPPVRTDSRMPLRVAILVGGVVLSGTLVALSMRSH